MLPLPLGADTRYCSECGRAFPASQLTSFGDVSVCTQCQPAYTQRLRGAGQGAAAVLAASGSASWQSLSTAIILWVATLIIRIPLGLAGLGAGVGLGLGRNPDPAQVLAALPAIMSLIGLSIMIQFALSLAYEVYFLSTQGATPGKMAAGPQSNPGGRGADIGRSSRGRYFGKILSWDDLVDRFHYRRV